ncbi:MAG: zinc ribbon domain-containing protein [Chloroflexota bacterium]|nr:zinc ribbon domain-containing protein [Chloroflexota bacterium]
MNCQKCGNQVLDNWLVCPRCGASLSQASSGLPESRIENQSPVIRSTAPAKHPSAWFYALGPAIIVITSIVAIVLLFISLLATPETRFSVPGTHEVALDYSGEYILFYEYKSSVDGITYSTGATPPDMIVSLQSSDDAQTIPLSTGSGTYSYDIGDRAGVSMFEFEIDEPGTYIISAEYSDGSTEPPVVFAVRHFDITEAVVRSLAIGTGGFVIGVFSIVIVFMLRRRKPSQPMDMMSDNPIH